MKSFLTVLLMGSALFSSAAWAEPDYKALALSVAEGQVIPGYQRFTDAAAALGRQAEGFCAAPDAEKLEPLRQGYHGVMDAWQGVQHVSFGPVEAFSRGQRVQFWPDKKNASDRQMGQLLKSRNDSILEGGRFTFASVAVQGLPALEYLLFGEQAERLLDGEDSAFRCRLVSAIAHNLTGIGQELSEDWTKPGGFRDGIATAGEPSSPYASAAEAASQMFNALHTQVEALADVKLAYPMGDSPEQARTIRLESWRSARSARNLAVNIEALNAFYAGGGGQGFSRALVAEGRADLDERLRAALERALAKTRALEGPMETVMATPEGWTQLDAIRADLKEASTLLGAEIAPALNIRIGFNALDGD